MHEYLSNNGLWKSLGFHLYLYVEFSFTIFVIDLFLILYSYFNYISNYSIVWIIITSTGAAVINPETAPTSNRGKGMVKDVVFAETKKAICRINSP